MRAVERAAGGGIAGAIVAQHGAVALLDLDGGMRRDQLLHPAVERDLGRRKGRALAACQHGLEPAHRLDAQSGDRDREFGGLVLDGIEPVRIGPRLLQQPVARAQRALQRVDAAAMLGIDRERQAIEEAPALRRRAGKQRVHRRHQPDHAQMIGEGRGRRRPARGRSGICAGSRRRLRAAARCRCRASPARARPRSRRRPPRSRRPR